jgi:4,5-DOPA dioxygenase extradiol
MLFVGHGAPTIVLEDDAYTRALSTLPARVSRPSAFVVLSAHWQVGGPIRVTAGGEPAVIYDFYGFPQELYALSYDCPGHPELARDIVALLADGGHAASAEPVRGIDHGVWIPLRLAWPAADVPVVQVSLPLGAPPDGLLDLGLALAPLRMQGVMLVASGNVVHNMSTLHWSQKDAVPDAWSVAFDEWARDAIAAHDVDALCAYRARAPHAALAVPTSEHYDPLLVLAGAMAPNDRVDVLFDGYHYGTLAMRTFLLRA